MYETLRKLNISHLNKLKAIDVWVKAEKKDAELQNIIAEQKVRTERILGELIEDGQRKGIIASESRGGANIPNGVKGNDTVKTLPELGISRNQSSQWKQIASIPDDDFEEFIQEKKQAVNNAVSELTTSGAVRLAQSINNKNKRPW